VEMQNVNKTFAFIPRDAAQSAVVPQYVVRLFV